MELWYEIASVLLVLVMVVMVPIRVKSKVVVVLHDALSTREAFQSGDSASAQHVRTVEKVAGVLAATVVILLLWIGYVAPYANWYEFEFRIPVLGIVALVVGAYAWRTMVAFNRARRIEAAFARSKESGES